VVKHFLFVAASFLVFDSIASGQVVELTSTRLWSVATNGHGTTPAFDNGKVYYTHSKPPYRRCDLVALHAGDGGRIWKEGVRVKLDNSGQAMAMHIVPHSNGEVVLIRNDLVQNFKDDGAIDWKWSLRKEYRAQNRMSVDLHTGVKTAIRGVGDVHKIEADIVSQIDLVRLHAQLRPSHKKALEEAGNKMKLLPFRDIETIALSYHFPLMFPNLVILDLETGINLGLPPGGMLGGPPRSDDPSYDELSSRKIVLDRYRLGGSGDLPTGSDIGVRDIFRLSFTKDGRENPRPPYIHKGFLFVGPHQFVFDSRYFNYKRSFPAGEIGCYTFDSGRFVNGRTALRSEHRKDVLVIQVDEKGLSEAFKKYRDVEAGEAGSFPSVPEEIPTPFFTGTNALTDQEVRKAYWHHSETKIVSTLLIDNLLYMIDEGGELTCVDLIEEQEVYKKRFESKGHRSKLIHHAGKILTLTSDGRLIVFESGENFRRLADIRLGAKAFGSPVVNDMRSIERPSDFVVYAQTAKALHAIQFTE